MEIKKENIKKGRLVFINALFYVLKLNLKPRLVLEFGPEL